MHAGELNILKKMQWNYLSGGLCIEYLSEQIKQV